MDRIKVQVVDDHFLFAQSLASVVREIDRYQLVGIAVTGPQALAMAREERPDVILMDYHLPGYSADMLVPRLLAAAPGTKVLVLTSDTSETALVNAVRSGASGFLTKDKAIDDVVEALGVVAAGGSLLTPQQREIVAAPGGPVEGAPAPAPAGEARPAAPAPADLGRIVGDARPPAESLEVRLRGVASFAHAVLVARFIERLPDVAAVHVRDVSGADASLRVSMAPGASADALVRAVVEGSQRLRVAARGAHTVELEVEAPLVDG